MEIVNKEHVIANNQLQKICNLLDTKCLPRKIIVFETRIDVLKAAFNTLIILRPVTFIRILLGQIEGVYDQFLNKVYIFIYSQTDDGDDIHSKQLYSLHALLHELRHRWQKTNGLPFNEDDADKFATNFLNDNSETISEIMNWEDEWEIEEE